MTIKIDQALTQWFLAGNFGLPIAHENQSYTPAGQSPWCEIRVIPNDVTAATIRHSSETDGVFRVILRYPQGTGAIAAKQKADQILAHFRLGTRLSFDGQRVNLTSNKRDQGVSDDGWFSLVLSIGYRVFIRRQSVTPVPTPTPTPTASPTPTPTPTPTPPSIGCVYPLDDDGTIAAAFGYIYAGPAVGVDSQSMNYTSAGAGGAILAAAGVLSTARFSRPNSGYAVFEALNAVGDIGALILVLSDSGGSLVNALVLDAANANDVLAITVESDGTVTAYINDIVETGNANWLNPVGQTTVGASDKFAPALSATVSGASENSQMTLRTKAADITGSYGAGGHDVCGNAL